MSCRLFLFGLVLLISSPWVLPIQAQTFSNPTTISWNYVNKPLQEVLNDIERKHKIRFSYTKDRLTLSQKVNFQSYQYDLETSLKSLLEDNGVAYAQIGGQWVLKNASKTTKRTTETLELGPETILAESTPKSEPELKIVPPRKFYSNTIMPIQVKSLGGTKLVNQSTDLALENKLQSYSVQRMGQDITSLVSSWNERKEAGEVRVFQFNVAGSSNKASYLTNIISYNLIWGVNGGLEGLQIAGLGSVVRKDALGMQFGLGFNGVGGNATGLQMAGLLNNVKGDLTGLQVAGLFNHSNKVMGGQISVGFNLAKGELMGTQLAGIGNIAHKSANSAQLAGLFNLTQGISNFQAATAYNEALHIEGAQLAIGMNKTNSLKGIQIGLVNHAKMVKGFQLGIINMADTVKGVSLGLFNIVRAGGYNKLEIALAETVNTQISIKMGARSLYHIYSVGLNLFGKSWGLGWGLGSVVKLNRKWQLNIEGVAMHINEDENWQSRLNLLTQARTTFEYNIDRNFSFFIGPSYSVMLSRYRMQDSQIIGSSIPVYTFFDHTSSGGTNLKMWSGFHAGIRFGLW